MSKGKKIGGIVLIIIGVILMVIGIVVVIFFEKSGSALEKAEEELERQLEEFQQNSVSIYGEIIDIDDDMATIEYYCAEDGYEYETRFIASDGYRVGSVVVVWYDPDDPTDVIVPDMCRDAMRMTSGDTPVIGIVVGSIFTVIGLALLIRGIVMLVSNHMDKKWTDEINARNAAQGIGNVQYNNYGRPGSAQYNGYQQPGGAYNGYGQPGGASGGYQQPGGAYNGYGQPGGAPNGYQQSNGAYNSYGQPGSAPNGYQQPNSAYNSYGQPGDASNPYQQPGQQNESSSNPYQQM